MDEVSTADSNLSRMLCNGTVCLLCLTGAGRGAVKFGGFVFDCWGGDGRGAIVQQISVQRAHFLGRLRHVACYWYWTREEGESKNGACLICGITVG